MSSREFRNNLILISFCLNVGLGATTFNLYREFRSKFFEISSKFFFLISLIYLIGFCIYVFLIKKGFKNLITEYKILNSIERNLISIGAFYLKTDYYYVLPRIKILLKDNLIKITTDDLKIRKALENYQQNFSSALPEYLIVSNSYFNSFESEFIIQFRDEREDNRRVFKSLKEYSEHIKQLEKYSLEIDNTHRVNLIDYAHFGIFGSTGSGKTYLTQLLLLQAIIKGFDVSVFDVKRSYMAFSDFVDYETEPSRIVEKLEEVAEEMKERQNNLSDILKHDPRALAVEYGYRQKIIFIEEYIGLKSMLSDNKEYLKKLENLVKEISVLARSVNISLIIVSQSGSVDLIDSSIKNNLNKIFMGYLASNIQVSTFGQGVDVPIFTEIKKGYGYIQLDRVEQIKVPEIHYAVSELEKLNTA